MGRARCLVVTLALLAEAAAGCKRGGAPRDETATATASSSSSTTAPVAAVDSSAGGANAPLGGGAIFSAPIAAARVAAGAGGKGGPDVVAVGLVVATRSVTASRIDASGKSAWTRVVVPDTSWSADAELHAFPIAAGTVVVWRGPQGNRGAEVGPKGSAQGKQSKNGHVAVVLAPDGRVIDGPVDIGSFVCATDDGLAWSEAAPSGATRVHLRTYGVTPVAPRDESGVGMSEEFTLTCGAHRAYAVVEGDEGTPTKVYAVGSGEGHDAIATIAPTTLGTDEERDLFAWANADEIGLVRIASGGAVQAVELRAGGATPIHAEKARVLPEDDVVGVDADARQVVLVTTHDESDSCPNGRGGSSVHALRIPRQAEAGSHAATSLAVAPSACGRDVGPFWTNTLGRSLLVGWAERASRPEKTAAPITGLAYRLLEEGSVTGRVAQAADAIVDAGCDDAHCYAVALVREPGGDGSKPGALRVLTYP